MLVTGGTGACYGPQFTVALADFAGTLASPTKMVCVPLLAANPLTVNEPGEVVTGFGVTLPPGDATLNGGVPPVIVNP